MNNTRRRYEEILWRYLAVFIPAFLGYKILVFTLHDKIPCQCIDYDLVEWIMWIINLNDIVYMSLATGFYYFVGFLIIRKMTKTKLYLWGALLGVYLGIVFYPFSYWSSVELNLDKIFPIPKGCLLEVLTIIYYVVTIVLLFPLISAWLIRSVNIVKTVSIFLKKYQNL